MQDNNSPRNRVTRESYEYKQDESITFTELDKLKLLENIKQTIKQTITETLDEYFKDKK